MRFLPLGIIGFLLTFAPIHLTGQITMRDSSEIYHYWAKRGIIEMIYSYMEDFSQPNDEEKRGKEKFKADFIVGIDYKANDEINSDFEKTEQLLKNYGWATTAENIFHQLKTNYFNYNTIDSSFFLIKGKGQGYRDKGNNCIKTQYKIINEYQLALHKITQDLPVAPSKQEHSALDNNDKLQAESVINKAWNIIFYPIIFLLGILVGFVVIYILFKKQIFSILNYEKGKYLNELNNTGKYFPKWLAMIELLKSSKDFYKKENEKSNNQFQSEIRNLKQEVKQLSSENERLEYKTERLERLLADTGENTNRKHEHSVEPSKLSLINMYFSIPDNEGRFMIQNGKKHNDGNIFYKVEYENNQSKGILHYISGELDKRAIEGIDHYLGPVCEIENISNRKNANRINVLNPGKVFLINDSWVIDPNNKVKIKLV